MEAGLVGDEDLACSNLARISPDLASTATHRRPMCSLGSTSGSNAPALSDTSASACWHHRMILILPNGIGTYFPIIVAMKKITTAPKRPPPARR